MYPRKLDAADVPQSGEAIVLVGNASTNQTINYLQFTHSSFPAINANGIRLAPGSVVAVPVPVGTRSLSLQNFTTDGRPGGYLPNGMAMGYVPVHTPTIDINTPGIYYVATLYPDRPINANFDSRPNAALLSRFKRAQPTLAGSLKPVNFKWPN